MGGFNLAQVGLLQLSTIPGMKPKLPGMNSLFCYRNNAKQMQSTVLEHERGQLYVVKAWRL